MSDNPKKRALDDSDIASLYEDPNELVNAVISVLQTPESKTSVAENFANDKNQATEIQAYAKIAGKDWTFYVKSLTISIGRNTDNQPTTKEEGVDIDLGPAKVVSRQHATIAYNLTTRVWELQVSGRNGAKVDGVKVSCGPNAPSTPLYSGCVVDIGGTQMMFILPDATPTISPSVLEIIGSQLPKPKSKRVASSASMSNQNSNQSSNPPFGNGYYYPVPAQNNLKAFQMFDNASEQLKHDSSSTNSSAATNQANTQNDLAKDESKDIKPPYSYATMITQAILSNPEGVLSLSQIYEWISKQYAFYRFSKSGWQNSIRHNLSLNKAFEKVPRRPNEPGKGMKWQIAESYKLDFLKKVENGSLAKVRRGSSVSRQLQLHLAQHNDLPSSANQKRVDQQHQLQQIQKFQQEFQLHPSEAAVFLASGPNGPNGQAAPYAQAYSNVPMYANAYPPPQLPPLKQQPGEHPPQFVQPPPNQLPLPNQSHQTVGLYSHSRTNSLNSMSQFPIQQYQPIPPHHAPPPQLPLQSLSSQGKRPITQDSNSTDRTELKPLTSSNSKDNDEQGEEETQGQESKGADQRKSSNEHQDSKTEESSPKKDRLSVTPPAKSFPPLYQQNPYNNTSNRTNNTNNSTTINGEETTNTSADQTYKNDTNSNIDFGMITSPTKSFSVSAVEAYTPERGTRKKEDKQNANNNNSKDKQRQNSGPGGANLQSSPALWNFVQFSTPLGPKTKGDDSKITSPTKNGSQFLPESPLNMKLNGKRNGTDSANEKKDLGDLKDVDLARGFQK